MPTLNCIILKTCRESDSQEEVNIDPQLKDTSQKPREVDSADSQTKETSLKQQEETKKESHWHNRKACSLFWHLTNTQHIKIVLYLLVYVSALHS